MVLSDGKVRNRLDGATAGGVARDRRDACGRTTGIDPARRRSRRSPSRFVAFCAAAVTVLALASCSQGGSKDYDIAPIFPLSADKCATYDGTTEGTGITAHCWVTKDECQRAAQDWRQAMQQGGVTDAIDFSCN